MRRSIEDAIKRTFRPELINRIDEIIIFDPLTKEEIGLIIELLLKDVRKRLEDRKLVIELTKSAKDWLVEQGFDQVFGARPLRRAIQRFVENPLAKRVLAGEYKEGEQVVVDLKDNQLTFSTKQPVAAGR